MIVGFHGRIGAGKNTAAERVRALVAPHGVEVREISYAAKLKQSAAVLLGCTVADLEKWKNDPTVVVGVVKGSWRMPPVSMRTFLQRYGTESHRDIFGQDFWLDVALPLGHDYSDALYLVTDIRFPNEADRIVKLRGTTVRLLGADEDTGDHPSEQVIECTETIDNSVRGDGFAFLDGQLARLLYQLRIL